MRAIRVAAVLLLVSVAALEGANETGSLAGDVAAEPPVDSLSATAGLAAERAAAEPAVDSLSATAGLAAERAAAEPAVEYEDAGGDVIGRLAGLDSLPPIPIILLALASNSIVTILVFGPPKSVQQRRPPHKVVARWLVQAAFFALAIAQLVSDVRKVRCVLRTAGVPLWTRLNGALALWVCSANTTKGFALQGMLSLHGGAITWAQRHGVPGAEDVRVLDTIGVFASWLYNVLAVCYMLPAFAAFPWSLPALCAFGYVLVPLYFVLIIGAWLVLTPLVRAGVRAFHRRGAPAPVALEASQPLSDDERAAVLAAISSPRTFGYEDQHECFLQTGAPLSAWVHFLAMPLLGPLIAFTATCNARLVSGDLGYWRALAATFSERTLLLRWVRLQLSQPAAHYVLHVVWLLL